MKQNNCDLHRFVIPALIKAANDQKTGGIDPDVKYQREIDFLEMLNAAATAMVFDCTGIDAGFLRDTGMAALEDAKQLWTETRLPFPRCYFQFGPLPGFIDFTGALCCEFVTAHLGMAEGDGAMTIEEARAAAKALEAEIEQSGPRPTHRCGIDLRWFLDDEPWREDPYAFIPTVSACIYGQKKDPSDPEDFDFVEFNEEDEGEDNEWEKGMCESALHMTFGVLALLSDKLLSHELMPDPAPRLNAKRLKRGRPPVSSEKYVLRLNMAAVRRVAKPADGTHESPRLHWRRGHDRVVHRGSEFEKKTWVRRCLVGDPDRGFIHKDYRLAWQVPMLRSS